MNSLRQRRLALLLERDELRLRSAALRREMAVSAAQLRPSRLAGEQFAEARRWLAANPLLAVGAVAAVTVLRPRRMLGWAGSLWWGWQAWQRFRPMVDALMRPPPGG